MTQPDRSSLLLLAQRLARSPECVGELAAALARCGTRPEEIAYARQWKLYAHLFREGHHVQETR